MSGYSLAGVGTTGTLSPPLPQVAVIRRAMRLSQDDFAARFHIPVGTLRDWEQGRKAPDAAAKAYLRVIAREPETVRRALGPLTDAPANPMQQSRR